MSFNHEFLALNKLVGGMTRIAGRRCIMAIIIAAQGATMPMDLTILRFKSRSFVVAVIMSGGV